MSRRLGRALLVGLAVAVYANTLGHGFVYDDFIWVVDNPAIRSLSNLGGFFSSGQLLNRVYRPLVLVSFSLDYALAGLRPWFYHAQNVLLHALVTLVVYRLLRPLGDLKALLAAALFAVLPVHTEVVANVTSRSELLATLLGLLALSQTGRPVVAAALLVLALLAKESAVAVPVLAPLLWWRLPDRPHRRQAVLVVSALLGAVAVYLAIRSAARCCDLFPPQFLYDVDNPLIVTDWQTRVRTAAMILGQNLALCFAPYHLSADYSFAQIPLVTSWFDPHFLLWIAFPIAAVAGALAARRSHPDFARGLAWFLVAMAPVSNLALPIGTIRAERLLYLASVGTCLMCAEALTLLLARIELASRRRWAVGLIAVMFLALGAATVRRNRIWRDQESLFTATVADAPHSAKAHFELAGFRMRAGNCAAAAPGFQRALDLYPRFELARLGLATCLEQLGDLSGAERIYQAMSVADPSDRVPAEALVRVCGKRSDWRCAAQAMSRLLAANRDAAREPGAWVALGNALFQAGEPAGAEQAYRRAGSLGGTAVGHFNLAGLLVRQGRLREALDEYQAAERSGLHSEVLFVDWAAAQERAGDQRGARQTAARGLREFPASEALRRLARGSR